ncbi:MAG: two-component sensor histidine kinase [Proteobacteria bacterium]|nr:two-component sensor histidine kinase [Pseudomonadota bacterium]
MFRSLSARLFAILTVGLGAIQVISFIAFMNFRGQEIKEQMTRFLGADLSFAYDFMRSLPHEQRLAWLARLNQGFHYRFSLEPAKAQRDDFQTVDPSLATLTAILKADLPPEAKLSFRLPNDVPSSVRDKSIQAVLAIDDNEALVLHLFDPFSMPSEGSLLLYLGVVLLAVSPFVWWAVHLSTRQIDRMLGTIEQFGRNLNAPPLPETGPEELKKAAQAVNAMRERIVQHIEERTQILAAIAHDLKTPLTRLRLRAEAVENSAQRERIVSEVEYMASLVSEGLDYARSAHLCESSSLIEVNHWLEGMVDDAQDAGATCRIKGQALAPYRGALRALTRAMQNLIENALKFGSEAEIQIEDSTERLLIRVLDNGPGLSDALIEKVFDPFFRAEMSRNRDTGGSGLGLSIARNIVRAHGGEIHLHNRAGDGLEVLVELPRHREDRN